MLTASGQTQTLDRSPEIVDLSYDSRKVKSGHLFFAVPGTQVDGHDFIGEAEKKGAVAAVVERSVPAAIPLVQIPSVLGAMPSMAHAFYGAPTKKMPVVGITGTNGKTTITYILEALFQSAGKSCGVMGTVNYRFGQESEPAPNTTPLPIDIHRFAHHVQSQKGNALVMEVSSHALALGRVDQVHFAVGVFTNLTQDHLDFHKDMDSYFKAKAKLFHMNPSLKPVVNTDDAYGLKLAGTLKDVLSFGFNEKANIKAENPTYNLGGIQFNVTLPSGKKYTISSSLMGRHNISNLLAAAGAALAFGFSEEAVVKGLNQDHHVPGRLERVKGKQDFVVVVDYAHTPDALAKVMAALKEVKPRQLITVFGAGGDRDRTKRPLMGKIAAEQSDMAIVTSDNPRTEDPDRILKDVEEGIKQIGKTNYKMIESRAKAIESAIQMAKANDIVLLAGKGHEDYQIYGHEKKHFSDREEAEKALKKWN